MLGVSLLGVLLGSVEGFAFGHMRTAHMRTHAAAHMRTQASRAHVRCMARKIDANGNEIKAALSSYMHFCAARRPAITAQLKATMGSSFKNPAVMTALGAEWKRLNPGDKAPFEALAAADKARYNAAVASNPANQKPKRSGPKKLSAYMHFCKQRRPTITAELKASMGTSFRNPAVMTALGAAWKQLSEAEKAPFVAMAAVPVD